MAFYILNLHTLPENRTTKAMVVSLLYKPKEGSTQRSKAFREISITDEDIDSVRSLMSGDQGKDMEDIVDKQVVNGGASLIVFRAKSITYEEGQLDSGEIVTFADIDQISAFSTVTGMMEAERSSHSMQRFRVLEQVVGNLVTI